MSISTRPDVSGRLVSTMRRALPALAVVVLLVAAWQIYVEISGIRPQVLPSPGRVLSQGWDNREIIGGLEWVSEPKVLRFFFGRMKEIGYWQEELVKKFREDFGDSL